MSRYVSHHPSIADISSPTDMGRMGRGDVKQIPKSWDIYKHLQKETLKVDFFFAAFDFSADDSGRPA